MFPIVTPLELPLELDEPELVLTTPLLDELEPEPLLELLDELPLPHVDDAAAANEGQTPTYCMTMVEGNSDELIPAPVS
jgi:hypothetical protein